MSKTRNKLPLESLADLPPEMQAAADAMAAIAEQQAAAEAAFQAEQARITARAYALLQEDQAAGHEISGWADYLARATEENQPTNN